MKEYLWAEDSDAPTIVLPTPAAEAATGTVFQVYFSACSSADTKDGGAAAIDAIGELYPDRVITPEVVLCFGPDPNTIRTAGFGGESHLKIVWRVD